MDTLTHTVLGACLGEMIAGRKLGKKAMLYGAIANNLPDIDVVASLWTDYAENLLVHRGITHSILVALFIPPLLARIFFKIHLSSGLSYKAWVLLFATGFLTHIFIDAFTAYGTGWFEPFNHFRVTFNTMFIIDPVFTLPLLVSAIILLILKRTSVRRLKWAIAALMISSVYLLIISINKLYINSVVKENIRQKQIACLDFMSTPTPLNNFLWYIIIDTGKDMHYAGYYSDFDKTRNIEFDTVKKNDSLLIPFKSTKEVIHLIQFSKNFYCITGSDSMVVFNDMRFGQIGGWYDKNSSYVFRHNLTSLNKDTIGLQRGRMESTRPGALKKLWQRIKGQ